MARGLPRIDSKRTRILLENEDYPVLTHRGDANAQLAVESKMSTSLTNELLNRVDDSSSSPRDLTANTYRLGQMLHPAICGACLFFAALTVLALYVILTFPPSEVLPM
jgi:hypothetical protein